MPDPSPSNADSLKLQLLTVRKKEWWLATAGSLSQAVTCQHCDTHYVSSTSRATYNEWRQLWSVLWDGVTWHISVMVSSNTPPASSAPSPTSFTFHALAGSRRSLALSFITCWPICVKIGRHFLPLHTHTSHVPTLLLNHVNTLYHFSPLSAQYFYSFASLFQRVAEQSLQLVSSHSVPEQHCCLLSNITAASYYFIWVLLKTLVLDMTAIYLLTLLL